jgi:hypothetical protein
MAQPAGQRKRRQIAPISPKALESHTSYLAQPGHIDAGRRYQGRVCPLFRFLRFGFPVLLDRSTGSIPVVASGTGDASVFNRPPNDRIANVSTRDVWLHFVNGKLEEVRPLNALK